MTKILQRLSSPLEATKLLYVSFSIRGIDLKVNQVTQHLGISPLNSFEKGDVVVPQKGTTQKSVKRPWGLWRLSTNEIISSRVIEEHFQYLLEVLEPKQEQLAQYLNCPQKYFLSFRIYREASGINGQLDIDSTLLARICKLCHKITIHYAGDNEL